MALGTLPKPRATLRLLHTDFGSDSFPACSLLHSFQASAPTEPKEAAVFGLTFLQGKRTLLQGNKRVIIKTNNKIKLSSSICKI